MRPVDKLALQRERTRAGGAEATYFKVEQYTVSGSPSAADPLGQGVTRTTTTQMIPARIVWGGRTHRLTRPDGAGGYIFIDVDATLMDIPEMYYEILRDAKIVLVPQYTETGVREMTCRVIDVLKSPASGLVAVRCSVDVSRQE